MESANQPTSRASARPRPADKEKDTDKALTFKLKIPAHRHMRYKEKFQVLREKYDRVNAVHDEHQRNLDIAAQNIKSLQAENDLLLDAIQTAAPHLAHLATPQYQIHDPQFEMPVFSPSNAADPNHPGHASWKSQAPSQHAIVGSNGRSNDARHTTYSTEPNDHEHFSREHPPHDAIRS